MTEDEDTTMQDTPARTEEESESGSGSGSDSDEEAEQQREEEQLAKLAALKNRVLEGPVITWWSGVGEWVGGKLRQVGKNLIIEEKEKPTKKRKAAEMEESETGSVAAGPTKAEEKQENATSIDEPSKPSTAPIASGDEGTEPKSSTAVNKEPSPTVPKEASQEAPKEPPKEASKEIPKEASKEAPKEVTPVTASTPPKFIGSSPPSRLSNECPAILFCPCTSSRTTPQCATISSKCTSPPICHVFAGI